MYVTSECSLNIESTKIVYWQY